MENKIQSPAEDRRTPAEDRRIPTQKRRAPGTTATSTPRPRFARIPDQDHRVGNEIEGESRPKEIDGTTTSRCVVLVGSFKCNILYLSGIMMVC